ncbi:MAG: transposase [Treponema sp.]|jgi:transposase|nr:transposase [Treponema sp.]
MKRVAGSSIKSWELTDELWEQIKEFIPQRKRDENRTYRRKPGAGRKPIPPRQVLEGILYVLRTGIQWKALPQEYGAASSIHEYFSEWAEAGFFRRIWEERLFSYEELHALGREWQRVEGCMVKGALEQEAVGKKGPKRSVVVETLDYPSELW